MSPRFVESLVFYYPQTHFAISYTNVTLLCHPTTGNYDNLIKPVVSRLRNRTAVLSTLHRKSGKQVMQANDIKFVAPTSLHLTHRILKDKRWFKLSLFQFKIWWKTVFMVLLKKSLSFQIRNLWFSSFWPRTFFAVQFSTILLVPLSLIS